MADIGIFYGSSHGNTFKVAKKLQQLLGGDEKVGLHNVKDATLNELNQYRNIIMGTSAWGIGDMQEFWDLFIDVMTAADYSGKKVALFGLGDQKKYPESFVDGMGTIFCRLPDKSVVVGQWPIEGYDFYFSAAAKNDVFVGLALDEDNQAELTEDRLKKWAAHIVIEFS